MREDEFRSDIDINILSAKYGLLTPSDEIEWYDQQMDASRAEELNPSVVDSLEARITNAEYDRVVINMGSTYRKAIAGLDERVDATIAEIQGDGIGEKGNSLYRFIRGDDSVLKETNDV